MHMDTDHILSPDCSPARANIIVMDAETHQRLHDLWIRDMSKQTARAYRHGLHQIETILNKPIFKMTVRDLPLFHKALKRWAKPTQRQTIASLRSYLRHLSDNDVMFPIKRHDLQLPKVNPPRKNILTQTDIQRLIACETDPRNRPLLQLLYETAARGNEITNLRWRDLKVDGRDASIVLRGARKKGLTGTAREVSLSSNLKLILQNMRRDTGNEEPIFRSQKGGPLTDSQVFRIVQAAGRRAKLPSLSPHDLRHAHITHALNGGAPLSLVQRCLGYASVATVARYSPPASNESTLNYLTPPGRHQQYRPTIVERCFRSLERSQRKSSQ